VYTCRPTEFVRNNSEQYRQGIEALIRQQNNRGSVFVYDISDASSEQQDDM